MPWQILYLSNYAAGFSEKQSKIKPGKYDFLNDLSLNKDMMLVAGGMWKKDDEGIKDYIMLLDNELNVHWERELEDKWEGEIVSIQHKNGFLVATNSNSGVFICGIVPILS